MRSIRHRRFFTFARITEWFTTVAAALILSVVGRPRSWADWLWVALSGTMILLHLTLASRREWRKDQASEDAAVLAAEHEARLSEVMAHVLTPIAHLIGQIGRASPTRRAELIGQLKGQVLGAAVSLCGPTRTRASFFALERGALRPDAWHGRQDPPQTVFTKSDPQGAQVIDLMRRKQHVFVEDTSNPPQEVELRPDALYRAFISVSVYAGKTCYGMLIVDTLETESLSQKDVRITLALAQFLGAGLSMT